LISPDNAKLYFDAALRAILQISDISPYFELMQKIIEKRPDPLTDDHFSVQWCPIGRVGTGEDPWKNTLEMGIISNGETEKHYKWLLEKDSREMAMSEDLLVYHSIDAMLKSILRMSMSFPSIAV
jgi:hypothetical protein